LARDAPRTGVFPLAGGGAREACPEFIRGGSWRTRSMRATKKVLLPTEGGYGETWWGWRRESRQPCGGGTRREPIPGARVRHPCRTRSRPRTATGSGTRAGAQGKAGSPAISESPRPYRSDSLPARGSRRPVGRGWRRAGHGWPAPRLKRQDVVGRAEPPPPRRAATLSEAKSPGLGRRTTKKAPPKRGFFLAAMTRSIRTCTAPKRRTGWRCRRTDLPASNRPR
jgi:hypothetical protein